MRKAGEAMGQRIEAFLSDLALSRGAVRRRRSPSLDTLARARQTPNTTSNASSSVTTGARASVKTRRTSEQRIHSLRDEHNRLNQEFSARTSAPVFAAFRVASAANLDGLPADFIAAHKPGPDGTITLTTTGPDLQPVSDLRPERGAAAPHC